MSLGISFALISKWAITFLVSYIILLAIMVLIQGNLLFHPTPKIGNPQEFGLDGFEEVKIITADNLELSGWFKKAPTPGKAIIFYYGNADSLGNYPEFFRLMADAGYSVLGVNYRGYAGNPGKPSETGLYEDAKAAYKFMSQHEKPENIIFVGRSLGSGVAVEMASKNTLKGLVLVSPYTSIVNVAGEIYWYLPVKYVSRYKFASIDKIANVKGKVLIIHGRDDALIPLAHAEKLFSAAAEPKELIIYENTGHNEIDLQRLAGDITKFFNADK